MAFTNQGMISTIHIGNTIFSMSIPHYSTTLILICDAQIRRKLSLEPKEDEAMSTCCSNMKREWQPLRSIKQTGNNVLRSQAFERCAAMNSRLFEEDERVLRSDRFEPLYVSTTEAAVICLTL